MLIYILKRLIQLVPVLLIVSVIVFSLIHLIPGDPVDVMMGEGYSDPVAEKILRAQMHLDKPIPIQYAYWIGNVLKGDFGKSAITRQPIIDMILARFPATILLALSAALVAIVISIPAGIIAAVRRNTIADYFAMGISLGGISIPNFWLGVMLILVFSQFLELLPSMGYMPFFTSPWEAIRHLIMPAITLGTAMAASLTRFTRSEVLEELRQDYVRTARAKGVTGRLVVMKHVLKNSLIPTITVVGLQIGGLLEGAVITETVFAWPGIGRLAIQAVFERDYPLVQGIVLVAAVVYVLINLLVDIIYTLLDPRIKLSKQGV
ncbi:ABC transporter permease [bacterium]|nr:ABC transporter permease [bacterium]